VIKIRGEVNPRQGGSDQTTNIVIVYRYRLVIWCALGRMLLGVPAALGGTHPPNSGAVASHALLIGEDMEMISGLQDRL
jgi:hypothetical protein